jgi:hypothetical protein
LDKGGKLTACGIKNEGKINALEIEQVIGKKTRPLFTSDDALKAYQLRENAGSFYISEGLDRVGEFRPFIEIKIACEEGNCNAIDHRCIWKKTLAGEAKTSALHSLIKRGNCNQLAAKADEIFDAALSGDQSSVQFILRHDLNCSAEGSEALETYRDDLIRLKKLNCI